ncbi:hypothetical protein D5F01_LYC08869 [Scomber scombrus]|uniref:Ubiquitin-like domain-containing protein n=1 Tax=Scomber scombrus TaxID=13677 RepID=A0AAV1QCT5_SCOSC
MQLRAGEHVLLSSLPPFWTQVGGHRRLHVSSEVKLSLGEFRIYSDDTDRAVGEKTIRQVFVSCGASCTSTRAASPLRALLNVIHESFIMLLRIILSENDIRKVTIDTLPETVHDFCSILKTKLGLEGDLVIQYQDPEFDNELCNLSSMSELPKDKATLKVHTKSSEYNTDSTLDTAKTM